MYETMANFRSIFADNSCRSISKEYYKWKIVDNPFKAGHIYVEKKDDVSAGSTTLTPKKLSILGQETPAAEVGDTFTHPNYRRQGVFSRGGKDCTEYAVLNGIDIVYGTPNSLALPGWQHKLGYSLSLFAKVKHLTKDLSVVPIIKNLLRRKMNIGYIKTLQAQRKFRSSSLRAAQRNEEAIDIAVMERFRQDFDGLWGKPRYLFFTIRDRVYLNWRFFDHPDTFTVLAAKQGDQLVGYVVIKISKDSKTGLICDFVTTNDRLDVFTLLVHAAEDKIRQSGVNSIQVHCSETSPYFGSLLQAGYFNHRDEDSIPIILYRGTKAGKKLLETNQKWHFTMADSDFV
jgi:Acetyltransferase (GNAT) domain